MEDTYNAGRQFGEIEFKLLKVKVLNDVAEIFHQALNKDENFLYPVLDANNPEDIDAAKIPLIEDEFMGHMYAIYATGSYPIAYVNLGSCNMDKGACDGLPVHGGCTYTGPRIRGEGIWYGWNYGHSGDFDKPCSANPNTKKPYKKGKKWTVVEVMEDVIKAILYIEENG